MRVSLFSISGCMTLLMCHVAAAADAKNVFVKSGEKTEIRTYRSWKGDCTPNKEIVELVVKPQRGKLTTRLVDTTIGRGRFQPDKTACLGKPITGSLIEYQSESGYRGPDTFTIEVTYGDRPPVTEVFNVTVRDANTQFERAIASIMAILTPQVSRSKRDDVLRKYLLVSGSNKALAVQLADGGYWRSSGHEDRFDAGDRALEGCQLRYGKPCAILAVNEDIAIDGEVVTRDMPRLSWTGKYDPSQIPIIREETRNRSDVQNYDKATEPKAMAIHPRGRVFISTGKPSLREAQISALAQCNDDDPERKGSDGNCFLYAVNNDVVLSQRAMSAR
jgi:hypothetical protein